MAKKEEIYPEGFPRQTESFSEAQKFKFDVYEAIKEIALETTEKAFEDKGYSKKEGRAGEYGTGENYGAGTELNHFNIRLSSRPNTNTYFEKIIYFGGKEYIINVSIGWDAKNKVIELAYKTPESAAFRGYHDKMSYDGAQLINDRSNFVIKSIPEFKKELKKIFKSYADKEVAHITSTKMGIEDKTEKSINSMVEHMKKNKLTLSNLFSSSLEEVSSNVNNYVNEAKKEKEEKEEKKDEKSQNKEKLRMNNPEVVAANSKGKLLFDDLNELEEGEYKEYIKQRMKEFGAKAPKELKPSEWAEINMGWKAKIEEIATAGSAGVSAIGGQPVDGTVGTAGNFKYAANPFKMDTGIMKRSLEDTNYSKGKKKRASMKREFTSETSAPYSYTIDLNPGSGYVPKGMEHNYVQGQHEKNTSKDYPGKAKKMNESQYDSEEYDLPKWKVVLYADENNPLYWEKRINLPSDDEIEYGESPIFTDEKGQMAVTGEFDTQADAEREAKTWKERGYITKIEPIEWPESSEVQDSSLIKESLVKRKFITLKENEEKGINKRYIVTEKRNSEEEKERWKRLSMMETYETIHKAETLCECMGECTCGCGDSVSDEEYVTMNQGQEENEQEFMQRNQDAEVGEVIDGKEVVIVAKPNSLSNAMFKVFKDDYMNENKAYILDLNSGNLVANPKFKAAKK